MRESVNDISSWPTSVMRLIYSELLSTKYDFKQINNNLTQYSIPVNTQVNGITERPQTKPCMDTSRDFYALTFSLPCSKT